MCESYTTCRVEEMMIILIQWFNNFFSCRSSYCYLYLFGEYITERSIMSNDLIF